MTASLEPQSKTPVPRDKRRDNCNRILDAGNEEEIAGGRG